MPFNPEHHLIKLKGKDYLEVKWRIMWLREEAPDAIVETELLMHDIDRKYALFRAHVVIPGHGAATGHGSETSADFGDYLEKAETKSVGRALATLGFGTQFAMDFEENGSVADAPVGRVARPAAGTAAPKPPVTRERVGDATATMAEVEALSRPARELHQKIANASTKAILVGYGKEVAVMTKATPPRLTEDERAVLVRAYKSREATFAPVQPGDGTEEG